MGVKSLKDEDGEQGVAGGMGVFPWTGEPEGRLEVADTCWLSRAAVSDFGGLEKK